MRSANVKGRSAILKCAGTSATLRLTRISKRRSAFECSLLLTRFLKTQLRKVLLGAFQVPVVARQKHGTSDMVVRHRGPVFGLETLELGLIRHVNPPCRIQARAFETHVHIVFGA